MKFGEVHKDTEVGDPAAGFGGQGASIPTGVIVMWHGLLSAIPVGWALCDGQNGTPDLRSRFVKGAAAGQDPGATGGAATHQHTYSDVPNHTHPITDPGHTHVQNAHTHTQDPHSHAVQSQTATTGSATSYEHGAVDTSSAKSSEGDTTAAATAVNQNATAVNQNAQTGITQTQNPTGGVAQGTTAAASSEPPYYAVAFIMKT